MSNGCERIIREQLNQKINPESKAVVNELNLLASEMSLLKTPSMINDIESPHNAYQVAILSAVTLINKRIKEYDTL